MARPISKFFAELGFPFRNIRWSWGARAGDAILLRTWQDEYRGRELKVTVLQEPAALDLSESFGVDERIVQLKALWGGEVAGYAVLAEVRDRAERPRHIKDYREDVVFPIKRLELQPNGAIAAELGDPVAVAKLREHSQGHRTAPGEGSFPVDDSQRSGLSTDSYQSSSKRTQGLSGSPSCQDQRRCRGVWNAMQCNATPWPLALQRDGPPPASRARVRGAAQLHTVDTAAP